MSHTSIKILLATFCMGLLITGCQNDNLTIEGKTLSRENLIKKYESTKGLFEYVESDSSQIHFTNIANEMLIQNIFNYEYSFNGGGVAIGDINNDGWDDIFFTATIGNNSLYINEGDMTFKDITSTSNINQGKGFNVGVVMVDINNDGWLDIYVCSSGNISDPNLRKNQLYINNKDLTFTEMADEYGIGDKSYSTQAYFFDCDLDGDLDMYLVNHPVDWARQNRINFDRDENGNMTLTNDTMRTYVSDRLYINENGKFKDKSKEYGIENLAFGLSAIIADFNGDNYPDIYVSNDYAQPDQFYINQNGKGFKNEANKYFKNISTTSMGVDAFDANNDGKLDIFVNDMMPSNFKEFKLQRSFVDYDIHVLSRKFGYHDQFKYNSFQIKNHTGTFSNVAQLTNTGRTDWSWAVLGEDYDNNGHVDLFITNGFLKDINNADYTSYVVDSLKKNTSQKDYFQKWNETIKSSPSRNFFFANNGNLNFDEVSAIWGSNDVSFSNGVAYADLDNDGDIDLVVNNINQKAFIMKNTLNPKENVEYYSINLRQNNGNIFSIGSEVTAIFEDGTILHKLFNPMRGYLSSCSYKLNFTVPQGKSVKEWVIKWPDGKKEVFTSLTPNKIITIQKGSGTQYVNTKSGLDIAFEKQTLDWQHKENNFIDFKREPLLHMKHSVGGPVTLISDFDGDGLDDIFLGGATGQASVIMYQKNGQWIQKNYPDFDENARYEDVAAVSIDFDGDGDKDIIVASGGYEKPKGDKLYELRAYRNDNGVFKRTKDVLPEIFCNAASLAVGDLDNDGDLDLILGCGPTPNDYPHGEGGYILINNKGKFEDATKSLLPSLKEVGIIKDIVIEDINGDGFNDIIICGDFQPIRVFLNQKGKKFEDNSSSLLPEKTHGLWQRIYVTDLDGDGDKDILVGNLGRNSFFQPTVDQPTRIYLSDFDKNKEMDPILTTYLEGQSEVVHSRDRLLGHMTKLRKQYLRYRDYAPHSIHEMFGNHVKKAKIFDAYTMESTVFYNNNGTFSALPLPLNSQLSLTNGVIKINQEGNEYLITTGNYWDTDYDFGKYDASCGAVYKINGKSLESINHNLDVCGNARNLQKIKVNNKDCFIVSLNNDQPTIYCLQ